MFAPPANAAVKVSNGVACTKSGATAKTTLASYRCTTNPLTTSKKLVWLNLDCIASANRAVAAEKAALVTIANFNAQIPIIDLGIAAENANKLEIQGKIADANVRVLAAQAKLDAATNAAAKRTLTTAVGSWNSAIRAYTSKIRSIDSTIARFEVAKRTATNKPAELQANNKNNRETAKLICATGF